METAVAEKKGFFSYLNDSGSIRTAKDALAKNQGYLEKGRAEVKAYRELVAMLPDPATLNDVESKLISLSGCILAEVRQGPRVTQRTGTSGGRGLLGTRIGPVYVGGMSSASNNSTSVSYPGVEALTQIDTGNVTVTTEQVTFIGEKYTRTIEFDKIADFTAEADWIRFASTSSEKVWTVGFERQAEMWIVVILMQIALSLRGNIIDLSGKATSEEIIAAFQKILADQEAEMARALTEVIDEIEKSNVELRKFHEIYPTRVADPGPKPALEV